MRQVNFSYEGPLSLLRSVNALLEQEGIAVTRIAVHPITLGELVNDANFFRVGKLFTEKGKYDGTIAGIPFTQKVDFWRQDDSQRS